MTETVTDTSEGSSWGRQPPSRPRKATHSLEREDVLTELRWRHCQAMCTHCSSTVCTASRKVCKVESYVCLLCDPKYLCVSSSQIRCIRLFYIYRDFYSVKEPCCPVFCWSPPRDSVCKCREDVCPSLSLLCPLSQFRMKRNFTNLSFKARSQL